MITSAEQITNQKIPRRTKLILDRLLANRQITPEGLSWLTCASDPFHDSDLSPVGYPDVSTAKSLVQTVVQTQSVTLATGKDLHTFFLPWSPSFASSTSLAQFNIRNNGFQGAAGTATCVLLAGLNLITVNTGADWTIDASSVTPANNVQIQQQFSGDQFRLIACGWELVNITPAINAGGSLTCYRTPNTSNPSYIGKQYLTVPNVFAWEPIMLGTLPPGNQTQAALYTNSRTWNSIEGLYQIAVMNNQMQKYISPTPGQVGFCNVPNLSQLQGNLDRVCYLPTGSFNTITTASEAQCSQLMNWDVSGSVIVNNTGFNQQFQVTVKYFFERVPTQADLPLLVLTRKPAPYDPVILETYSKAMAEVPVGCTLEENPLGEWFEKIMDVVGNALPTIGKFIPIPGVSLIGDALGKGAKDLSAWNKGEREKEENSRKKQSSADKKRANSQRTMQASSAAIVAPGKSTPAAVTKRRNRWVQKGLLGPQD